MINARAATLRIARFIKGGQDQLVPNVCPSSRILHVFARLDRGGAEQLVMTWYRQLDLAETQFDFVVDDSATTYAHEPEVEAKGGRIYRIPRPGANVFAYAWRWYVLLRKHPEWRNVHVHHTSPALVFAPIGRALGRRVLVHSHTAHDTGDCKSLAKRVTRLPLRYISNELLACSEAAGRWMFGGVPFRTLPNAIDVVKYEFDVGRRKEVRSQHAWGDGPVILHIGRFTPEKNHAFLLEVFAEVVSRHPDARLVLLGDGPLFGEVEKLSQELGLSGRIAFCGSVEDVASFVSAADIFILPSLFEGFPMSLIEAQAGGLLCLMSDRVTSEVIVTPRVQALALERGPVMWADAVSGLIEAARQNARTGRSTLRDSQYDARESLKEVLRLYRFCGDSQ